MILNSNENSLVVNFNLNIGQTLLSVGYDNMSIDDKNNLIAIIAYKEGKVYSDINSDYILNYHKQLKLDSLDANCENAIISGFTSSNGHTYRLNRDDQINMIGQRLDLEDDPTISTVYWRQEDVNDWVAHTRDEWLTIFKEAFSHKQQMLYKCKQLKLTVTQATKPADILAVNWS